jgi:hypothetical protein
LRAVLGSATFEALSIAYLTAHPAVHSLCATSAQSCLNGLPPIRNSHGRRHRLAVDVARIEWAFVESFDNADHDPLTLEQIATLDASSRLALQPHLQLIALDYPADDLVLALHDHEKRQTSEAGVKHDETVE